MSAQFLNDDMWREILLFLDLPSLGTLISSSKSSSIAQLATEDHLWQKQTQVKLSKIALLVSQPWWTMETDYPTEYHSPSIYCNYFRVDVNVENRTYSPNVQILIEGKYREKLGELFRQIEKLIDNKVNYLDMIQRCETPFQETLFMSKDELHNIDGQSQQGGVSIMDRLQRISNDVKFHCAMLGEVGSGRTSMIFTLGYGEFPEFIPGVYENFELYYVSEGKKACFELWDFACSPDYDRLRIHGYPIADMCCVCFSVSSSSSLELAITKFIPEIRHHKGYTVPIILIGCKIDEVGVKFSKDTLKSLTKPITYEEGQDIAKRTGCITYFETSSLRNIGLDEFLPICAKSLVAFHSYIGSFGKKKNCQVQ